MREKNAGEATRERPQSNRANSAVGSSGDRLNPQPVADCSPMGAGHYVWDIGVAPAMAGGSGLFG